jgi:shikimate dehydrogenase
VASEAPSADAALTGARIVVNATPAGLGAADDVPVDVSRLESHAAVVDLVYRRDGGPTPWVRQARERGLRAEDGLTMLIAQGALAFERWFGFPPDREAMWNAVR